MLRRLIRKYRGVHFNNTSLFQMYWLAGRLSLSQEGCFSREFFRFTKNTCDTEWLRDNIFIINQCVAVLDELTCLIWFSDHWNILYNYLVIKYLNALSVFIMYFLHSPQNCPHDTSVILNLTMLTSTVFKIISVSVFFQTSKCYQHCPLNYPFF
jgi:hypothetical protein